MNIGLCQIMSNISVITSLSNIYGGGVNTIIYNNIGIMADKFLFSSAILFFLIKSI